MKAPVLTDLPYLEPQIDRHGRPRLYVRRNGKRIRIREAQGTPGFLAAYQAAIERLENKPASKAIVAPKGTWGWLAAQYFASAEFLALDTRQQDNRRQVIEHCLRETTKPGSKIEMAFCPLAKTTPLTVKMLVDRKRLARLPGAANNRRKYLGSMFSWAVDNAHMRGNPARDVKRVRYATTGFHTWTVGEVRQFQERHPLGTKAHLAMGLLLFLGMRRQDMVGLGRQHVKDGWVRYIPQKTSYKRLDASEKPIIPTLANIISQSPCGDLTFLMTEHGAPFSAAGFGNWFRSRCNEAGLPHCSAHGLKKAAATIAAENGATHKMMMSIFDWSSQAQADTYIQAASKKRLAGEGMKLLSPIHEQQDCLTPSALPHRQKN